MFSYFHWEKLYSFQEQTIAPKKLVEETSLMNKEQGNDQPDANKEYCSSAYPIFILFICLFFIYSRQTIIIQCIQLK